MARLKPPKRDPIRPEGRNQEENLPPLANDELEDEEDNRIVEERLRKDELIPFDEVLKRYGYARAGVENRSHRIRRR